MAAGDGFYRKARKQVEDEIGEPVAVLGWASRCGAMGAVVAGAVMRGAGTVLGGDVVTGAAVPAGRMLGPGGAKGARLPVNFIVALAPSGLRVFKLRKTWTGLRLKGELGTLPRDGLRVAVQEGGLTMRFRLDAGDGSAIAFEMARSKFARAFAADLQAALA